MTSFAPHCLLVTGGAGFIGSNFVRWVLERDKDVTVVNLDLLTYAGNVESLEDVELRHGRQGDGRYVFVRGDIRDLGLLQPLLQGRSAPPPDGIAHFAAESHVDRSIIGPSVFVETNVQGTLTLLEACRTELEARPRPFRFLHVSTDEVYGAVPTGASLETDRLDPTSPYSAAKAGGELLVLAAHKTYGLPAIVVRGANAYGPYQYPEKLIPLHITNAIDDQSLPMYGDGQQRRQWTHVSDFASAVDAVLRRGTLGEIYNIGNPEPEALLPVNLEISRRILSVLGKPESLIEYVVDRPAHDRRYRVNLDKLGALGWQPEWRFADGLDATVQWYVDHPHWWRPIKSGEHHQAYYALNYADRSSFAR